MFSVRSVGGRRWSTRHLKAVATTEDFALRRTVIALSWAARRIEARPKAGSRQSAGVCRSLPVPWPCAHRFCWGGMGACPVPEVWWARCQSLFSVSPLLFFSFSSHYCPGAWPSATGASSGSTGQGRAGKLALRGLALRQSKGVPLAKKGEADKRAEKRAMLQRVSPVGLG